MSDNKVGNISQGNRMNNTKKRRESNPNKKYGNRPLNNSFINTNLNKSREKGKEQNAIYHEPFQWKLFPVIIIVMIIPLIMREKAFTPHLMQYSWYPNSSMDFDFFLYYKQWAFVLMAAIMATVIFYKYYTKRKSINYITLFIPLGIYAILSFLSALFSKNPIFSFAGSKDQFESVWALLGYCIVVFYIFNIIKSENDVKNIIKFLGWGSLVMSLLGLSQFVGKNFFETDMGKRYIGTKDVQFNFPAGRVFTTLFNPNYVGVYVALLVPLFAVLLLFSKKIVHAIFYLVILVGLALCAVGSQSLAGFMGIIVAFVGILIFLWRYLIKRFYITIPVAIIVVIALFILNNKTDNYMLNRVRDITKIQKTEHNITNISTNDENISITYKGNIMNYSFMVNDGNSYLIFLTDENNNTINYTYNSETNAFELQDERFPAVTYMPVLINETIVAFKVNIDGKDWVFSNQTGMDNTYYYLNSFGKFDKIIQPESAVFTDYDSLATGRGYIWSRSIPLVKSNIILGSGPDTFITEFPQQDYLGYFNNNYQGTIITKPHNLYLQIAVQTGLLSLIAFLVFYGMYFIWSIKLYIRGRFNNYYAQVGVAIFIGTIAYMVTGLTNDSSVTTAPIFWTLIGLGITMNYLAKPLLIKEQEEMKVAKSKE